MTFGMSGVEATGEGEPWSHKAGVVHGNGVPPVFECPRTGLHKSRLRSAHAKIFAARMLQRTDRSLGCRVQR